MTSAAISGCGVKMSGTRIWLRADCDFLTESARFSYSFDGVTEIVDRRLGRVALRSGRRYVTVGEDGGVTLVAGPSGTVQDFQWIETPTGELVLMSLATNRVLRIDPKTGEIRADSPGPMPDDSDGARFIWSQ